VVDLQTEFVLSAQVYTGTEADPATLLPSLAVAQVVLLEAGSEEAVQEAAADKGYHKNEAIADCAAFGVRTYIPEPEGPDRKWTDKPPEHKRAVENNRRRTRGDYGRKLGRLRSELVERSFAHVCDTGGARRTWLRGLENVRKRYAIQVADRNLGLLMRKLFGVGKPRALQGASWSVSGLDWGLPRPLGALHGGVGALCGLSQAVRRPNRALRALTGVILAT
jgi:transposase